MKTKQAAKRSFRQTAKTPAGEEKIAKRKVFKAKKKELREARKKQEREIQLKEEMEKKEKELERKEKRLERKRKRKGKEEKKNRTEEGREGVKIQEGEKVKGKLDKGKEVGEVKGQIEQKNGLGKKRLSKKELELEEGKDQGWKGIKKRKID